MKILSTSEKYEVQNYPYGYTTKTTKFYSVEFKKGKGFRLVVQTLNPKTGKLNKPKCSTYSPLKVLVIDQEGKIRTHTEDFYREDDKDRGWQFIFENFDKFQTVEIQWLAIYCIHSLKADIYAKATYCGSNINKLLPLYDEALHTLAEIAKNGGNLWNNVKVDWEAVEALKIPGYNPFKVTTHTFIVE